MRMWLRQATLTLGSNQYTLDGLNFSFKVQFEDRAKVSTAQLEVYNLSPSTRASLKKGDVGCIFVGAIADYSHQHENLDIITKITAADCLEEWLGTYVNKTYKAGMYAKDIVDDLLNIFGVEVAMVKLAENKHYPGCRVCRGKLKDVLTEIACSDCKSRLVIRCGQIIINPPEEGITTGYLLTPQTGLLKSASTSESQNINTKTTATEKTRSQQAEDEGNLSRDCLLNYHIGVADKIVIRDSQTNGTFMVVSGVHEGTRSGNWKTTVEVKPA